MSEFFRMHKEALDRFELPVACFDSSGIITFANDAAEALLQRKPATGISLDELFRDEQEAAHVRAELDERMRGDASAYRARLTRPGTGERIPVSIFAFPEVAEDGAIVGSIAIARDLREQVASDAMHEAIETSRENEPMLTAVAHELSPLVAFDTFRISAISKNRQHLRRVFSNERKDPGDYPFKWWPIRPFMQATIDHEVPRIIDVEELFSQPDFRELAKEDPAVRHFRESGVKHILSIPVWRGDQIVAFIALDSQRPEPFTSDELALCERLPLAQAVLMALHYEDQLCLQASLDLIRDLSASAGNVRQVADTLSTRLSGLFDWDYVAVFQYDENIDAFRALSQAGAATAGLPAELPVRPRKSIIGHAFDDEQVVNIADMKTFAAEAGVSADDRFPGLLSKLVVPVPGEQKRWIVDIRSRLANAFSAEEIDTVQRFVAEAGFILERAALLEMSASILRSVNDAVIETDGRGVIRKVNPATETLLDATRDQLIKTRLADHIVDMSFTAAIEQVQGFARQETLMKTGNGERVPVLLSGAPLPDAIGGKVFVASDLTYQKEVQRIDLIKEVFRQAAFESRVPLALAATWLNQLATRDGTTAEIVEKILKQLRKVDLPLERLMRRAAGRQDNNGQCEYTDLGSVVEGVLNQLPRAERDEIRFEPPKDPAMVPAPEDSLRFCVESMLSFALRTKPQDRPVSISLTNGDARISFAVRGDWSPDLGSGDLIDIRDRWRRQAIADLALGQDVIEQEARSDGGRFTTEIHNGLILELDLPRADAKGAGHGMGATH